MRIARSLGNSLLVLLVLGTVGLFLPAISGLGEIGPVLLAVLGPWMTLVLLLGSALVFRRGCRKPATLLLAALAAFAAIGTGFVQMQQLALARANGVDIDPGQVLLARSQADDRLKPTTVIYARHQGAGVPLDIYPVAAGHGSSPAPVFVYIHGGGWGAQTLKQRQADYRWFAERGYLVVSLEYSLASATQHTWNVAEPQLACALAWIGANATRFGGDPKRLALWGESAGGNLVLNLAYRANAGKLTPTCAGQVPRIAATIALYPVIDPARMYHPDDPLLTPFGRMMTVNYTGGTPEQFPDRYAAIASASHIDAKAPPTLLIVPEADHLVAPEAAYDFAARTRAAGIDTRLIRMPYAEHAFDLRSGSIGNQLVRQAMLRFLQEHGLAGHSTGETK